MTENENGRRMFAVLRSRVTNFIKIQTGTATKHAQIGT